MGKELSNKFIFIKSELLGKCPHCSKEVFSDMLYVKEENGSYHLPCHINKKAEGNKEQC